MTRVSRRKSLPDRYGSSHRWLRRQYALAMRDGGGLACARCGRWITPGERWHLGHPDGESPGGPECVKCNVSAPARLRRAARVAARAVTAGDRA
jgi:hypothetical protein